ncbi:MAG TPA: hypothetical protein VNH18_11895, partial [Bryobacteraceae bacterium]|nr:hypothetical protein [Bryobacteraceae bacterium]
AIALTAMCAPAMEAQTFTVVNAAAFQGTSVAPGSIVTIFGTAMTNTRASVTDPAHPPTSLGGTTVTIGGKAASLFYVSPAQINAVVAADVAAGVQPVTITSGAGTFTGTVTIDVNAQPGLFSMTGTGTHDGAIIDALTGRVGAFSVTTGTKATFLALFLTGANFTTAPTVRIGGISVPVTFAGASPCCVGLQQINVSLTSALAGAGRVPIVVQAGGQTSNVVEIVILPAHGQGETSDDRDNADRSRELSAVASIPGTSLALVADENDDVVREIDIAGRKVLHTIALPSDSEPSAVAVNAAGTLAVVAERKAGKVAILDLAALTVKAEVPTGAGPLSVAIVGTTAVVVNGDSNTVTIINLTTNTVTKTVTVGSGARAVALDAAGRAYVTNQNDGTISVLDVAAGTVVTTLQLGASRPAAIQIIPGTTFAVVTDPAVAADGRVLVVNLTTGAVTPFAVNVNQSGGSNDVVVFGTTAYIANQAGGSISILPLTIAQSGVTGTATTLKTGLGVRALAIDVKDNALLVLNQSTGTLVVISLDTKQVVAEIKAVIGESGDEGKDDHGDHDGAANLSAISTILPQSGRVNSTVNLTITGTNLQGATSVKFLLPGAVGDGRGKGTSSGNGKAVSLNDTAFTVTNIQVNAGGTQLTATVNIAVGASAGIRLVQVSTPNGDSVLSSAMFKLFTVLP